MMKLSDTQAILLSSAAQREGGSLYPLPASLKLTGGTTKAIDALISRDIVEERETSEREAVRRSDGDVRYGVFITAAGLAAIGVEPADGAGGAGEQPIEAAAATRRTTKAAAVVALLQRPVGATIAELIEATGWLPHTTRAALTGLRKQGHRIERGKRADATCYGIKGEA